MNCTESPLLAGGGSFFPETFYLEITKVPTKRSKPWKKPAPKKTSHTKLSSSEKQAAKRSAKRAGRPYPNLVDNMKVASRRKKKTARTKKNPSKQRH